jgi:hypothetical protein
MSNEKLALARRFLEAGHIFVRVDTGVPGVVLPPACMAKSTPCLQLGHDLSPPISDLSVDQAGLSGTLSFKRTPFFCVVPWAAVVAVADGDWRGQSFEVDQ